MNEKVECYIEADPNAPEPSVATIGMDGLRAWVIEAARTQVKVLFCDKPDVDLQQAATQDLINAVNALDKAESECVS